MKTLTALLTSILMMNLIITNVGHAEPATDEQSHPAIISAVEQFLHEQLQPGQYTRAEIDVGHLDTRLQLQACPQALETFLAPGSQAMGKTTVGVRCTGPKPWALYVSAMVNLYTPVYKTASPLTKGHIITNTDVIAVETNLAKLNAGYFTDKNRLIGQQVRRSILKNQVIKPSQVKPQLLVKRGQQVGLIAKSDTFSIKMAGQAMMDGARGDRIRVKNLSSNRIIEGIVTQNGEVTTYN
ncbi:MAG: flagellar basal body P-ring formation chaperone FlgA [Gammaproteobacteria bacterium]|nr:flagellar basal body P-ring formation chaperone FlgA [Gammaproteobacteria bacterium]